MILVVTCLIERRTTGSGRIEAKLRLRTLVSATGVIAVTRIWWHSSWSVPATACVLLAVDCTVTRCVPELPYRRASVAHAAGMLQAVCALHALVLHLAQSRPRRSTRSAISHLCLLCVRCSHVSMCAAMAPAGHTLCLQPSGLLRTLCGQTAHLAAQMVLRPSRSCPRSATATAMPPSAYASLSGWLTTTGHAILRQHARLC